MKKQHIIFLTYLLLSIHFLLNFMGQPILKWHYLIEVLFFILCTGLYRLEYAIIPVFALFFIEGQGRIIWEYHPLARICFDLTLFIAILRSLIIHRKLIPDKKYPLLLHYFILLHFGWYVIQLANPNSVGPFGVLAASKIYIFPFFIFFLFITNPLKQEELRSLKIFILSVIIAEGILAIFQMQEKESAMLAISPYYQRSLREVFTGQSFRPYGTTFYPGAWSVYLAMTVGLIFIAPAKNLWAQIIVATSLLISWFNLFIMQIRTALLKHVIISLGAAIILLLISKHKTRSLLKFSVLLFFIAITATQYTSFDKWFPKINFEKSLDRIMSLADMEYTTSRREGISGIASVAWGRLISNPMGLGPGRTGAATSTSLNIIKQDPVYNMEASWACDNLFISLLIDLGVGMIFYLVLICAFPALLIYYAFVTAQAKKWTQFRVIGISAVTTLTILIGNWASIGLTYNPESLIFWFFVALGLNSYKDHRDSQAY